MTSYSVGHLSDHVLVREIRECVTRDRENTAALLARLAEIDARRLFAQTKYDSMFAWCVGELHLSEDAAGKRLTAARKARRFPALFAAVADGRLHLSGVCLLAPHLTPLNCDELIAAATRRSKAQIEKLLADWFPRPDLPNVLVPLVPLPIGGTQAAAGAPAAQAPATADVETPEQHAPGRVEVQTTSQGGAQLRAAANPAGFAGAWPTRTRVVPLSPGRYGLQATLDQKTHDLLLEARELLGHAVPSGDYALVLERALAALVSKLARRRRGAPTRDGRARRPAKQRLIVNERHVPDRIKNAVWERDDGRCTFVDSSGRRCESRTRLEFDHVTPVARGGLSTAANLRLRCRTHNQYEARQVFGAAFVRGKVEKARRGPSGVRPAPGHGGASPDAPAASA